MKNFLVNTSKFPAKISKFLQKNSIFLVKPITDCVGISIRFWSALDALFILPGMECSCHSSWNGMKLFHFCRNGMRTPFQPEWNDHSIPAGMKWVHYIPARMTTPFLQEWSVIPLQTSRNMYQGSKTFLLGNFGPKYLLIKNLFWTRTFFEKIFVLPKERIVHTNIKLSLQTILLETKIIQFLDSVI